MKITRYALLFAFALLSANCHEDDPVSNPAPAPGNNSIAGNWHLRNVSGGLLGVNDNFAAAEIIWSFDAQSQTVTVVNANNDPNKVDLFDSGTYSFAFVQNPATPELCAMNLEVDQVNWGCYQIGASQMQVSMIEADGYQLRFERVP